MNGKVNAVTLGLANLFTNKVASKLSEEIGKVNGRVFTNEFLIMGSNVFSRKTVAELEKCFVNFGDSMSFSIVASNLDGGEGSPKYVCTALESVSVVDENGKSYFTRKFHFGDKIPPIIVDFKKNAITVDPDWVAPN